MTAAAIRFVCLLALGMLLVHAPRAAVDTLDPRVEAAARLYREQGAERALPVFEKLAAEFTRDSKTRDQAAALHYVGECHWRLGNFTESHRNLEQALTLERESGDRLSEGKTLNVLGLLSWDEGNYDRAIAHFRKAGDLARAVGDKKLQGSALNNLSLVYDEQGDYDTSLQQYQQALELYRDADFPRGVGDTLGNIGGVYLLLGHFREALGYYRQALEISERLKSKTSMSQDQGNIGLCLLGLGEVDAGIKHIDQAIQLAIETGMRQDQAYWLRVKGDGLVQMGRYDLGLENYRAALAIYGTVAARAELAEALHGSGKLYLLLGDSASAQRDFKRALHTARSIGLHRGITLNLVALGDMEFWRQRPEAAIAYYDQARQRAAAAKVQHGLALSLLRLARVNRSLQAVAAASVQTDQALAIARAISAPALEAEALYSRAELARLQERNQEALRNYQAAEAAGSGLGDPDVLWRIYLGRARAQEANGDVPGAVQSLEAAIALIEGVRGRLQEPRFRSGYMEDKFEVYLELMRLQLQQGNTAGAFATAERLRARSFVEQLGGRAAVALSAGDRRKETELRERVRRLRDAAEGTDGDGARGYPERAVSRLSQELARAERAYATFLDDRARRPDTDPQTPSASSVRRRLAAGEALLQYVVGPDRVVVFVLTSQDIHVASLPLREAELAARVALLRDLTSQPGDDRWLKPAARLSALLIEPLEQSGWLRGVTHLYIVPHGSLVHLPFAVLPHPATGTTELLIDRYTVAYLPAAAALLRRPPGAGDAMSLLAVAPSRGGLRHAPEEARTIQSMFQPHARTLIGDEATEGRFKQLAGDFRVLHLATHGHFNQASPLLSGLEFEADAEEDGMLRVHEILDLRLGADLVTLSACDTALGSGHFSELPTGDEFIGLNRAFLAAGSTSVMATLWQVDDRASVSLMKRFYGRLSNSGDGRNVAGALASAQREQRRSQQLGHPYYWAAYVVVGQINPTIEVTKRT